MSVRYYHIVLYFIFQKYKNGCLILADFTSDRVTEAVTGIPTGIDVVDDTLADPLSAAENVRGVHLLDILRGTADLTG